MDAALLQMEEDGMVLLQSDGSISLTDMRNKQGRIAAQRSKS